MRIAIVACVALLIGLALGLSMRDEPTTTTKYVYRDAPVATKPKAASAPSFPTMPKPPVQSPTPVVEGSPTTVASNNPIPAPLVGDLPRLPAAGPGGFGGPIGPMIPTVPTVPTALPTADLNADEALARRLVLAAGGDIVSSSDAKDASGKIGRALVAEASGGVRAKIEGALRRSLGDRVILSDGGSVGGSSSETRKAEDALAALRKQRDQARIDFLPNAPTLLDIEEAYRKQERALADLRKAASHQRLNVLIRPALGG